LLPLLLAYHGRCCRTMMTVSHIHDRNFFSEEPLDLPVGLLIPYNPEMMTYAVTGNEIILRLFLLYHPLTHLLQFLHCRVGKEDRFNIGIVGPDMNHAVLLLIRTGKLMLLDYPGKIVGYSSRPNDAVLSPSVHCLCVDVEMVLPVINQPSPLLP